VSKAKYVIFQKIMVQTRWWLSIRMRTFAFSHDFVLFQKPRYPYKNSLFSWHWIFIFNSSCVVVVVVVAITYYFLTLCSFLAV